MTNEISLPTRQERNWGIDMFRIVSMLFVVTLHVLGQGGVLGYSRGINNNFAWLLEVGAYCSVNCYALISGYVGVRSKFKYTNIVMLWLQVAFYTVLITVLFAIFHPEMTHDFFLAKVQTAYPKMALAEQEARATLEMILCALLPASKKEYWYFSAYFCMFFFIPLYNYVVNHMPRKQMRALLIASVLLFSVLPTIGRSGLVGISTGSSYLTVSTSGYTAMWLSTLYLIGAYISKYNVLEKIPKGMFLVVYGAAILISWVFKLYVPNGGVLVSYTSPTILLSGVALLFFFARVNLHPLRHVIKFLSPLAFSVYLIHVHPLIWKQYMLRRYVEFASFPTWKMLLAVFCAILGVYLFCSAVDLIRHYLFKLLGLKKRLEKIEEKICGKLWAER